MGFRHNHMGRGPDPEKCDPTPKELPVGAVIPDTLEDIVARLLHEQRTKETMQGYETPEEADDFEDDDIDTLLDFSPYELPEVQEEYLTLPAGESLPAPPADNPPAAEASPEAGKPDASPQADQ